MHSLSDLTCSPKACSGEIPPGLVGASTTVVGSRLFLFGGRKVSTRKMTAEMFELDLETLRWEYVRIPEGELVPRERYFHSVDLWHDKLVLFGGMAYAGGEAGSEELTVLDDILFFDVTSRRWSQPQTTCAPGCTPPRPRYAHLSSLSGDKLVIAGGQGKENQRRVQYIEEIAVLDLAKLQWLHTRTYNHQCGSYRSVAVSSSERVVIPQAASVHVGNEDVVRLPYASPCTEEDPSDIYVYSNYNFQDLKRELEIMQAPARPDYAITDQSDRMRGTALPPGLRFPTGAILGDHLVISGTYLANTSQSFSIWALELSTLTWQRIDPGVNLATGSWNRGTLWKDRNRYIVLGNRDRSLVTDYNHRQQNYDHIAFVELEAFGIYQPPPSPLSFDAQLLGLQALREETAADLSIVPSATPNPSSTPHPTSIRCSSKLLASRWPWFRDRIATYETQLSSLTSSTSTLDEARLAPRQLKFPESYPVALAFLQWIYAQALVTALQNSPVVLASLLTLAKTYGIEDLERDVLHAMHYHLEPATAVATHETATLCGAKMLQIRALRVVMASNKRALHQAQRDRDSGASGAPSFGGSGHGGAAGGRTSSSLAPGGGRMRGDSSASYGGGYVAGMHQAAAMDVASAGRTYDTPSSALISSVPSIRTSSTAPSIPLADSCSSSRRSSSALPPPVRRPSPASHVPLISPVAEALEAILLDSQGVASPTSSDTRTPSTSRPSTANERSCSVPSSVLSDSPPSSPRIFSAQYSVASFPSRRPYRARSSSADPLDAFPKSSLPPVSSQPRPSLSPFPSSASTTPALTPQDELESSASSISTWPTSPVSTGPPTPAESDTFSAYPESPAVPPPRNRTTSLASVAPSMTHSFSAPSTRSSGSGKTGFWKGFASLKNSAAPWESIPPMPITATVGSSLMSTTSSTFNSSEYSTSTAGSKAPSIMSNGSSGKSTKSVEREEKRRLRAERKEKEKILTRQRVEAQRLAAMKREGRLKPVLGEPAPVKTKADDLQAWGSFMGVY